MTRPVYAISGGDDILPAATVLRRLGRRIIHDEEAHDDAFRTLRSRKRFVVIAHGLKNGTVRWRKSSQGQARDWLWVGMPRPPKNVLLYLYCCHVGRTLPRHLKNCQTFGHVDAVPLPTGPNDALVLGFLNKVHALVLRERFDSMRWRTALITYLEREYVREVEKPTSLLGAAHLLLLMRSLGYVGK